MSAFVVDKPHIDGIIRAGLNSGHGLGALKWFTVPVGEVNSENYREVVRELQLETADAVGDMLLRENVRSVSYRYPGNADLPGPVNEYWLEPYTFAPFAPSPEPVEVLKAIICLEYQSCEHPEWGSSEAKAFCDALTRRMIPALPGYADAPWEWTGVTA